MKGYLHTLANLGIGFGLPLLLTGISMGARFSRYGENGRHCWCSLDNPQVSETHKLDVSTTSVDLSLNDMRSDPS